MRRSTLHRSATALACTFVLACSSEGGDAADASGSGTTDDEPGSTSSPVDPTAMPPADESTDDASDADSSESGTEPEPDPYDGEWCGTASTGPLGLGDIAMAVRFARSNGGPLAFAGWVTPSNAIQVATYEISTASWSEPVTLFEGYSWLAGDDAPLAAVDAEGNAIVAHPVDVPEAHMVVHRYDAATATWTRVDLSGTFGDPKPESLSMTPSGHATLVIKEGYDYPAAWFLDPASGQWSEPTSYPDAYAVAWAQDPETGDVALAAGRASGVLSLQHHDAATGVLSTTDVELDASAHDGAAIGNGEFILLSNTSFFGESGEIYAHHFDGGEWQPAEAIGSGYDLRPVRIASNHDGHAVASWNDGWWGTYARTFDRGTGWGEPLTANPSDPSAFNGWADHRVALDDEGFTIVWSTFGDGPGIRTSARRYEAGAWEATFELDPQQVSDASRIGSLESLGVDRLRALWGRDNGGGTEQRLYACHTPVSGWSAATLIADAFVWRLEARPGGDVLLMAEDATGKARVEYFAAQ